MQKYTLIVQFINFVTPRPKSTFELRHSIIIHFAEFVRPLHGTFDLQWFDKHTIVV